MLKFGKLETEIILNFRALFQYMHCYDGHHGPPGMGEIPAKSETRTEMQELESISRVVHEGKAKAHEIRSNMKGTEAMASRLGSQYNKAQNEINETFQFYTSLLEERKAEIMRELDAHYSMKQMALSAYNQKAQETIDKVYQVSFTICKKLAY